MTSLRVVGFSGSTRRPSRTRTLVEAIAKQVARRRAIRLELYDLTDAGPDLGAFTRDALRPGAASIVRALETADALIVGTPVYKGSYTGLFKHLFDFVDPAALAGTPVILSATGGGTRHSLITEHQLRPLFGFFEALSMPTSVYASDGDFRDGAITAPALLKRIDQAAAELAAFAEPSRSAHPVGRVA
ncbi:FMN reductase [Microvirga massiliensis]|uniref:FMN reductase n=1 Tax=Microvirga massiliensis TaxID=1033741 RepID=UPI00062B87BC|nr:FMN reductase [Microvirga massiliensis]